jgi:signal transduction histidine kinase/ActR/RegA family two-component response regulator
MKEKGEPRFTETSARTERPTRPEWLRVLFIESDPGDAIVAGERLAEAIESSFLVTHVGTASDAIAELQHSTFDAIIADLRLPDLQGIEVLRSIRAAGSSTPITAVVAASLPESDLERQALLEGAEDVISNADLHSRLISRSVLYVYERHRARVQERVASEHAAFLDALLEQAPDGVLYLDPGGVIRFGRSKSLLGTSWFSLPPEADADARRQRLAHVLATGESVSWEGSMPGPTSSQAVYWATLGPVRRRGAVVGAVLVTRDVSEKKRSDAQLMVADRMVSVGTMAAGVAHEINNPLATLILNLELAGKELRAQEPPVNTEILDEIKDARDSAERVRQIVRDLRIFSRAEDDKTSAVDVQKLMESTLRMAWNEIRHRARVVRDYRPTPHVLANESRLGQVFLNLVVNAAQAIPEGNFDQNAITVSTELDSSGRVVVRVGDSGPGIPSEVQKQIFTPFFTTKPLGVGTGLGLSICHRIVTSLGGEITFETQPDKGTVFRVTLLPADAAPISRPPTELGPVKRGRVLAIDDEASITLGLRRFLSPAHDVFTVDGAAEAIDLLRSGERFDVILCDLMMPQVTGMDVHAELIRLDADQASRMVFITGGAFTPRARRFLESVQNHRVEKPFDMQGLVALVNALVRRATSPS